MRGAFPVKEPVASSVRQQMSPSGLTLLSIMLGQNESTVRMSTKDSDVLKPRAGVFLGRGASWMQMEEYGAKVAQMYEE